MQTGGGGGGGSPTPTPSPTPPPVCTATYPGAATLTYPPNNGQVSGSQVTLQWQAPGDWGTGCPENNDHYLLNVYNMTDGQFVKDAGGNDYNHKWIGEGQTSETVPLGGLEGKQIAWRVITDNGTYSNEGNSQVFRVASFVSGTVYLDANNSCSTSQPSNFGGGMTASLRNTSYSDTVVGANGRSPLRKRHAHTHDCRGAAPLRPYETLRFWGHGGKTTESTQKDHRKHRRV